MSSPSDCSLEHPPWARSGQPADEKQSPVGARCPQSQRRPVENSVGKRKCHLELVRSWISILCPSINEGWSINILVSESNSIGEGNKAFVL